VLPISLQSLNLEQQKATLHAVGPAIVLAGAGSGKTRVLTSRVAHLLSHHSVAPNSILLLTFTNKAANEMKSRILKTTGKSLPYSGTFHSISARILRQHSPKIGFETNFSIYDSNDQISLLKLLYKKHNIDSKQFNIQAVKAKISEAKNELISSLDLLSFAQNEFQETVARLYDYYNKALLKNQALDFDDLLTKVVLLLQTHPDILQFYQEQFQYLLIDEYQDTNTVQYELTKLLCAPQDNLFVVGDFAQSIYAWRGANYRNMLRLKDDFLKIEEYRLSQNYRSTQTILDAATHVISKTTEHPVLNLWTEKKEDYPITLIESSSNESEANQVIRLIQQELNPTYSYQDIAILYRTNAQSRAFEEACLKAGIPYQIIGGFKFYERKEVKDVLSYVQYYVNPADTVSYNRAQKLGKRKLLAFESWKQKVLENKTFTQNPHEIIKSIIDVTKFLSKYNPKDEEDFARIENIQELLNVASQFDSLVTFLENIALIQDNQMIDDKTSILKNSQGKLQRNLSQSNPTLTLMSLHSAKGLEFPVVFMVGVEEGLLPHNRSLLDKNQLEEERRLCYVGITRAKEKLFLSYASQRWQFGFSSYTTLSRFVHDIPPQLMRNISETGSSSQGYAQFKKHSETQFRSQAKTQFKKKTGNQINSQRRLIIDEDTLDGVLSGEFDIDSFLDQ
jgi:DNA helicase II / ATP-dependent DNA helicase PcrA